MKTLSQYFDVSMRMSSLKRYSQTHLMKDESVLEHTGFVCLLSYFIGKSLVREGIEIDMGVLLSKATVHDLDEVITGDIPRPTKYSHGVLEALRKVETENMKLMSKGLDTPELFDDWNKAKAGLEGSIISVVDSYAVLYKGYQEFIMFGNRSILWNMEKIREILSNKMGELNNLLPYATDTMKMLYKNTQSILEEIELCK